VASVITHTDGSPITKPSKFCRLCAGIIRKTDKGCANCFHSDAIIGRACKDGPIIQKCLSGGLWDAGAGITVGGKHVANWLIGQVRDETQTEDKIRAYAREIGANEDDVAQAFKEVPSMSRKQFENISKMLFTLATQLSTSAYQNIQQARFIFERKEAENALRKSEARYARAIRGTNDGFWEWNINTNATYLSPRWKELLGFEDHELDGHYDTFTSKVHPDDISRVEAAVKAHFEQNVPYKIEHRMRIKNGEYRWFLAKGMAERNKNGEPTIMAGSITDITDIKQAESDLSESEARYARAIRGTNDGFWEWNIEANKTYLSPRWKELLGFEDDEIIGHYDTFAERVHPDDAARVHAAL
jgi:PAS domain S-box-containing protein